MITFGVDMGGKGVSFYMYITPKDFLTIFLAMQRRPYRAGEYRLATHVKDWTDMALYEAVRASQGYATRVGDCT